MHMYGYTLCGCYCGFFVVVFQTGSSEINTTSTHTRKASADMLSFWLSLPKHVAPWRLTIGLCQGEEGKAMQTNANVILQGQMYA